MDCTYTALFYALLVPKALHEASHSRQYKQFDSFNSSVFYQSFFFFFFIFIALRLGFDCMKVSCLILECTCCNFSCVLSVCFLQRHLDLNTDRIMHLFLFGENGLLFSVVKHMFYIYIYICTKYAAICCNRSGDEF